MDMNDLELPRFKIKRWLDRVPMSDMTQSDGDGDDPKVVATQYRHARYPVHIFEVHIEHPRRFMDIHRDADNTWTCRLKQGCSDQLLEEGIEYLQVLALGVFTVGVGKFCQKDEAQKMVMMSIKKLVESFGRLKAGPKKDGGCTYKAPNKEDNSTWL